MFTFSMFAQCRLQDIWFVSVSMFKPFLSLSFVPAQKCSKQLLGIEAAMADAFV